MERSSTYPTRSAVSAAIAAERAKRPRVNAQGRALPYAVQPEQYRAAVTEEAHVAAHGVGLARDLSATDRSGDV